MYHSPSSDLSPQFLSPGGKASLVSVLFGAELSAVLMHKQCCNSGGPPQNHDFWSVEYPRLSKCLFFITSRMNNGRNVALAAQMFCLGTIPPDDWGEPSLVQRWAACQAGVHVTEQGALEPCMCHAGSAYEVEVLWVPGGKKNPSGLRENKTLKRLENGSERLNNP